MSTSSHTVLPATGQRRLYSQPQAKPINQRDERPSQSERDSIARGLKCHDGTGIRDFPCTLRCTLAYHAIHIWFFSSTVFVYFSWPIQPIVRTFAERSTRCLRHSIVFDSFNSRRSGNLKTISTSSLVSSSTSSSAIRSSTETDNCLGSGRSSTRTRKFALDDSLATFACFLLLWWWGPCCGFWFRRSPRLIVLYSNRFLQLVTVLFRSKKCFAIISLTVTRIVFSSSNSSEPEIFLYNSLSTSQYSDPKSCKVASRKVCLFISEIICTKSQGLGCFRRYANTWRNSICVFPTLCVRLTILWLQRVGQIENWFQDSTRRWLLLKRKKNNIVGL